MIKVNLPLLFLFLFVASKISSQTLPVGTPIFEDYFRLEQLNGNVDSTLSFSVRPVYTRLSLQLTPNSADSASNYLPKYLNAGVSGTQKKRYQFQILPLVLKQQLITNHPYQWNDGIMVPAKGYQTMLSGGVFLKAGPLRVQLRPELLFAQNSDFTGFSADPKSYPYSGNIDQPERFGNKAISRAGLGQSSIRLTFNPVSLGISNENLWWGPGIRNSLLMSNTAPGFKHVTLNTTRPVRTPLGSLEAQMIGGKLEDSGLSNKRQDWRYLSGFVFSYHPKWIPGLFLGLSRTFQMYNKDMDGKIDDYIPFLQSFSKVETNEGNKIRDQLTSVFARWLWREEKAEIYAEFGRNDHSYNLRDFAMTPDHSRAYLFGFSKSFNYRHKQDEYLHLNFELTQLQQSVNYINRDAGAWYIHGQVLHGYTQKGEVLGAGIGPGSNLQTFALSWNKGLKKLGVQIERYEHNRDYFNAAYNNQNSGKEPWIDFSTEFTTNWLYKNILFESGLAVISSRNYYWEKSQNALNGRARVNVIYAF